MTTIWTKLLIIFIVIYAKDLIKKCFNKEYQKTHKERMNRLDELRRIPVKTITEQKEFIKLKEGKPFVWSWNNVGKIILNSIISIGIIIFFSRLWDKFIPFNILLWQLIIVLIILPLIINTILKKYGIHNDDIRVFFRGGKK